MSPVANRFPNTFIKLEASQIRCRAYSNEKIYNHKWNTSLCLEYSSSIHYYQSGAELFSLLPGAVHTKVTGGRVTNGLHKHTKNVQQVTWCASSCETTRATHCLSLADDSRGLYSNDRIKYVIRPQFSIAPAAKSGIAIWSNIFIQNITSQYYHTQSKYTALSMQFCYIYKQQEHILSWLCIECMLGLTTHTCTYTSCLCICISA